MRAVVWARVIGGNTLSTQFLLLKTGSIISICLELHFYTCVVNFGVNSKEIKDTTMRKAIPTDKRIAMTLWFLVTGADYRTISELFGVLKSTLCLVAKEVALLLFKFYTHSTLNYQLVKL